jgi:hypothetical protein
MDIALTSFGKKSKWGVFFNKKEKGIFWYKIKKKINIIQPKAKKDKFKFSRPMVYSFFTIEF